MIRERERESVQAESKKSSARMGRAAQSRPVGLLVEKAAPANPVVDVAVLGLLGGGT